MRDYGRNVQRMVEHALTIEDREERERCVERIIRTMQSLFPYLRNEESRHVVYDHLALMSDFRLDIDWPFGLPQPEEMRYAPERLPYNTESPVRMRHYGRIVDAMVQQAVQEQDEEKRHYLTNRLANKLKMQYLLWNKDQVEPQRIIDDIAILSGGRLTCDFPEFTLLHAWQLKPKDKKNQPAQQGKKKKK